MPARSLLGELGQRIAADRRIGADLPDHEVRPLGLHVGFMRVDHLRGVLAADALVEDMDVTPGIAASSFILSWAG